MSTSTSLSLYLYIYIYIDIFRSYIYVSLSQDSIDCQGTFQLPGAGEAARACQALGGTIDLDLAVVAESFHWVGF